MRAHIPLTGSRAIGPRNPPPVLKGERLARPFNRAREQADSSWPPYHAMLERVDVLDIDHIREHQDVGLGADGVSDVILKH